MILEGEFFSGGHLRWNLGWPTPNYAGAFLATLLALAFVFSGSRWRWAFLAVEAGGLFLLAKTYSRGAVVGSVRQVSHIYTYDEVGNRTATLAAVDADRRGAKAVTLDSYHYDETYQVTGADYAAPVTGIVPPGAIATVGAPASTARFTYDSVGNRIEVGRAVPTAPPVVTRYAVNNLNQYTQVGEFTPTHDRNGNLSGMGQWLYRYDAMNRLVFASNGVTTANFYYDAKNRCVASSYTTSGAAVAPSTSTFTLNYYDNWNLIEERNSSDAQQARYVHGRRIDEIIVMVNRHGTFYPHHDALGNVTMLTDAAGRLVERYTYSVTGQVAISDVSGKTLTESAVGNRWMFTGREWLKEVGLYDYRSRVYSAELGRFLQTDPIRFNAADVNIYRYCGNGYTSRVDPTGEAWSWATMALGAGTGFIAAFVNEVIAEVVYDTPMSWNDIRDGTIAGAIGGAIVGFASGDPTSLLVVLAIDGALAGGLVTGLLPDDITSWGSADPTPGTSITYGPLEIIAYQDPVSDNWVPTE